jgi:solute carrier family 25 protein 34/35
MQPADTVRQIKQILDPSHIAKQALTRMYNQPVTKGPDGKLVGLLYKGPIDCLWKTLKTEGALAWYKGS